MLSSSGHEEVRLNVNLKSLEESREGLGHN